MSEIILHLNCPDQYGIIARITQSIYKHNANIISLEQHVEPNEKLFFMRAHIDLSKAKISYRQLKGDLDAINKNLNGKLEIYNPNIPLKVAILCTKEKAHLSDLLMRSDAGELNCIIPVVISNHNSLRTSVEQYGLTYHHLPTTANSKSNQEKKILKILKEHKIDLIVLARYMQILSPNVVNMYRGKIINIHHAFLPAFKGDRPYHKAWRSGVKMIGATAHYVTEDLDEGPIIKQDVEPVTHHSSINQMIQSGRDIERRVLVSAVKAHTEYRILIHGKRTLIFQA